MTAALAQAVQGWEEWSGDADEDPTAVGDPALLIDPAELARAILGRIDDLFDEIRLPARALSSVEGGRRR